MVKVGNDVRVESCSFEGKRCIDVTVYAPPDEHSVEVGFLSLTLGPEAARVIGAAMVKMAEGDREYAAADDRRVGEVHCW